MKPGFFKSRNGLTTLFTLIVFAMAVSSCGDFKKSNVATPPSTEGKVDFTRFVSLGNSLVAGYESGALYQSAQVYSYPNQIAQQAAVAMGKAVDFEQPLISDPGIGGRLKILNFSGPVIGADPSSGLPLNLNLNRPYNNLGVPGAILSDMMDTTSLSNPNPFFGIVLRSAALGKSCVQQALVLHPTFVTMEIGDNDILGYATSGGTTPYNPVQNFESQYTALIDTLLADAPTAKFAIANIPDVTAIPFVTTVPDSFPNSTTGKNIAPFLVERHHADGTLHVESINAKTDYILLTAIDSLNAKVGVPVPFGTGRPLPDQFVLDSLEVATAQGIIDQYNNIIKSIADSHQDRIALVDIHALLTSVAHHGYVADGIVFTSSFIQGGLFGLDGVHPTAQGYGIVANQFIQAINGRFGSNIPLVSISSLPGSIVLELTPSANVVLPRIHYSDLKPMLDLIHRGSF